MALIRACVLLIFSFISSALSLVKNETSGSALSMRAQSEPASEVTNSSDFISTSGVIIVRGSRLYNAVTGERFFLKGMTYDYAVSDDYYTKYSKEAIAKQLENLEYNTLRIYNVNPDASYKLFMKDMAARGVYILVSGTPDDSSYYGKYRYATMAKHSGPEGTVDPATGSVDKSHTCYPALLLEYGKRIMKQFAAYDNTLAFVVANEVLQGDLTAAACVKQYTADLKIWMRKNAKLMRMIPLAYAAADSSYSSKIPDADEYHTLKLQGLLCGDTMQNGVMQQSIDIYLINEYRWCPGSTYSAVYQRFLNMAKGLPIVVAFGEYGCKISSATPRGFENVQYLYQPTPAGEDFTTIWSGGLAYAYGEGKLDSSSLFPLFTGGSGDPLGLPSSKPTKDYANLKAKFAEHAIPKQLATWKKDDKCTWTPPNPFKADPSNKRAYKSGWIVDKCKSPALQVIETDTWLMDTREGVVCNDEGSPCDVKLTSPISAATQVDLCGSAALVFVDSVKDENAEPVSEELSVENGSGMKQKSGSAERTKIRFHALFVAFLMAMSM